MKNFFMVPATIQKIATLKDQTFRLTVDCQEISPEEMVEVFRLKQTLGYFLFKENEITKDEVPDEDAPESEDQKSLSQRLRNTLFVYWKQRNEDGRIKEPFAEFRRKFMEKRIQQVKDLID